MRFGFRELVFFIVLLGMPIAAYFFVFEPANAQIEQLRKENLEKQTKLDQLKVTQHIKDLGQEITKLSEAIDVFQTKLPNEKDVEVILKQVWQLAVSKQLISRSVRTEKPIKTANYIELPIKMELFGNFDGFYAFLLDLEKISRITRIHNMKMSKMKDHDGNMKAAFTLSVFFEPHKTTRIEKGV